MSGVRRLALNCLFSISALSVHTHFALCLHNYNVYSTLCTNVATTLVTPTDTATTRVTPTDTAATELTLGADNTSSVSAENVVSSQDRSISDSTVNSTFTTEEHGMHVNMQYILDKYYILHM